MEMANTVATRTAGSTAVAALTALKTNIANVKATLVKKGGEPFLRLLKDGTWVYGQEDIEVEAGSAWAVNPLSIMHGWVAWERGDDADNSKGPEQDIMVPASLPLPDQASLPKLVKAQKYEQQFSFSLLCLTGEDSGTSVLYKTASVGGVAAVDKLLSALQVQLNEDPDKPVPVIVLETDSYNHKKYKKTYTPILAVKQWAPLSGELPDVQAELDVEEGTETETAQPEPVKPTRQRKAAAQATAPEPEPEEEDELAAMERKIAEMKAAKDAQKAQPAEDPVAAKKRALQAQLDALNGGATTSDSAPAAGQPLRRRRA